MKATQVTRRLWRILREQPDDYTVTQLANLTRGTKKEVREAMVFLEDNNLIRLIQEE